MFHFVECWYDENSGMSGRQGDGKHKSVSSLW